MVAFEVVAFGNGLHKKKRHLAIYPSSFKMLKTISLTMHFRKQICTLKTVVFCCAQGPTGHTVEDVPLPFFS